MRNPQEKIRNPEHLSSARSVVFAYQQLSISLSAAAANPHCALMNSAGSLLVKSFIVFYRDCYIPFHSLDFVRSHGAPKLLNQGPAPMPEFAKTRFCLPEPVIPRKAILAIAPKMGSPTTSSSSDGKGMTAERTGGGSYHGVYQAVEAGPAAQNWCSSHDGRFSFSWKELPVSGRVLPFVWAPSAI